MSAYMHIFVIVRFFVKRNFALSDFAATVANPAHTAHTATKR